MAANEIGHLCGAGPVAFLEGGDESVKKLAFLLQRVDFSFENLLPTLVAIFVDVARRPSLETVDAWCLA